MAHVLGAQFKRIQFTPDTTPDEITGVNTMKMGEPVFMPGVVFTNVLLADEINRTPPRTQAALLEAMQERTVTVEGRTHQLPDPFLVIATQNPYEHEGIFPLPESQLDRFLFKIILDYCDAESEIEMLRLPHTGVTPDMLGEIQSLLGVVGLDKARAELDETEVPDEVAALHRLGRAAARGRTPGSSSARARARRSTCSAPRRRRHGSAAATTSRSTTSATIAPYVLRHRLICRAGHDAGRRPPGTRSRRAEPVGRGRAGARPAPSAQASASASARCVSTRARCFRNSAEAAVSLDGSVPSAACAAASAGDAPPATASSTAVARSGVPPMFVERDRRPDGEPLSRWTSAATPTVAQSCARRWYFRYDQPGRVAELRHPDLRQQLSRADRGLEHAGEEVGGRDRPLAAGADDRRTRRRARASPPAGRRPGRRGRASRRSCRDGAPADRRSCPPSSTRSGSAPGGADRGARRRGVVSAPIATWVPASRT